MYLENINREKGNYQCRLFLKNLTTGLGVDGCGLNLVPIAIGGPFGGFTLKFLKTQLKDMTIPLFVYNLIFIAIM